MIAIVESGATKSDWRIIGEDGKTVLRFLLPGMNLSSISMNVNKKVLAEGLRKISGMKNLSFHLYTAGIVTEEIRSDLIGFICSLADVNNAEVQDDLLGAARSILAHSEGIVAILGTGSNACFYDGQAIRRKIASGGYVIGDDGSAATLGRLFLADFIKNLVPQDIAKDFASAFDASYEGIVENVYRSPSPSGYLGSLAPFIISNYGNPYIREMVDGNFRRFITRSIKPLEENGGRRVGIVGGFGCACRDIFTSLCRQEGIETVGFLAEPIQGLINYHLGKEA